MGQPSVTQCLSDSPKFTKRRYWVSFFASRLTTRSLRNKVLLTKVVAPEPPPGERIIGFHGRSWWGDNLDAVAEFGIITAPKDLELPDAVYEMDELKNTDGGHDVSQLSEEANGIALTGRSSTVLIGQLGMKIVMTVTIVTIVMTLTRKWGIEASLLACCPTHTCLALRSGP